MKGRFSRILLMIAGIATVVVILLSQSLYQPSEKASSAVKKEQQKDHTPVQHVSVAPDVVPGPAAQIDKITPSVVKNFIPDEASEISIIPDSRVFVSFAKALLQATISPNAP
jgi:hypothetical protein